ncbi:Tyrosinase [Fusarium falciforme]|uniref:Tyrosinase n=1 Tax=Fusarium falciforme TaxID=195108 RepID=UPI002300AE7A|nr:Tyrosinase [Fusarium falciforme]WAO92752.1 Tyrosinase [Fusarium falciforme]
MRDILLLGGLFGILATAQPYNYGADIQSLTRRQDTSDRVVIKPLPIIRNGTMPLRYEIREMKADRYKWDLFILALSMLQYTSQDDPRSWYQIAGIHGVPFEPWSGVESVEGGNMSGYCMHSSVLFSTWHRPYLALFEQELYQKANAIAGMFPNGTERQAYQDAARSFRMPYWDWSLEAPEGDEHFPGVFWNATISQYGPRGIQLVRNPLYSYYFHPKDEEAFIWTPLNTWDETKRAPNVNISENAPPSNNSLVNTALLVALPEIQQRLLGLFSNSKTFNDFGTKVWSVTNNISAADSIESIHDIIHIHGGLKGHMTYVPVSSFDPLFILHHTMTDRLLAMWQILNPDAWMAPMPSGETTFTSIAGEMQDSTTPLTPFFASEDGTFWNSDMARTTEAFGYSYADTDASGKKEDELRDELTRKITEWYGDRGWIAALERSQHTQGPAQEKRHGKARGGHLSGIRPDVTDNAPDPPAPAVIKNGRYMDWVINARVNIEAFAGNFQLLFFIGPPPIDASQWLASRNRASKVTFMGTRHQTGSRSLMAGSSPLTAALVKLVGAGEIPSLDPKHVVPFLEERLQFAVLGGQDTEVNVYELEGLHITINSGEMVVPEKGRLPQQGPLACRMRLWPDKSLC